MFRPALTHPRLGRLAWLALPLIVGQSVVVLDEQFVRIFGSLGGEGAVSLLNYARRIMMVPRRREWPPFPVWRHVRRRGPGASLTARCALRCAAP